MKIDTIRRWAPLLCAAVFFVGLFAGVRMVVHASSADLTEKAFEKIGTTEEEFYPFCFDKIEDCFALMDSELAGVGIEHDLLGVFKQAKEDTLAQFAGVKDEESALDVLNDILEGVVNE